MLSKGKFLSQAHIQSNIYGYVRAIKAQSFPYNRFFTMYVHKDKYILLNIGV